MGVMLLIGNEPDFPVVAIGTCSLCKRENVPLRETPDDQTLCADLTRCGLALLGCPDELLRAEIPDGEMWSVDPTRA